MYRDEEPFRPERDYTDPTLGIGNIRGPQGYAPGYAGPISGANFDWTKWLEELERAKRRPTSAFHTLYGGVRNLGTTYQGRKFLGTAVGMGLAGGAASGAFGGAGAGAAAAAPGGAAAPSAAAGWIDPFVAGGGLTGAGVAGVGTAAASAGSEAAGWIDPFVAGGGLGATGGPAGATAVPWYNTGLGQTAIKSGLGYLANRFLNQQTGAERGMLEQSRAPYESWDIQRFLPPELRQQFTGPMLQSGMEGIAELLRNPGGLSPTVSDAIRARLAQESQGIAQSYRGIASQQAGAAARGNLPVSIKSSLQSALDIAQERAQRGARQTALTESDMLRRQDLQQVYALLDTIMQMISARQGQAVQGLGAASQSAQQRQAATLALISSLLSNVGTGKGKS